MTQRRILNLAIIGVPEDWAARYAPALERLEGRARVATVFDPLVIRAEREAWPRSAWAAGGIRAALCSRRVDAALLLESGWQSGWPLQVAAAAGLPTFIGQHVLRAMPSWLPFERSREQGVHAGAADTVPECRLRYQPALLRLRELMATKLGRAEQVRFHLSRARRQIDPELALREVLNWIGSSFEVGSAGVSLEQVRDRGDRIVVELSARVRSGSKLDLQLELAPDEVSAAGEPDTAPAEPFCEVRCQAGSAVLLSPRRLEWEGTGERGGEQLGEDRSASAVALDLFARRAVGGLVPVAALSDLACAQRLADQIDAAIGLV